jgi:hypothetical protein
MDAPVPHEIDGLIFNSTFNSFNLYHNAHAFITLYQYRFHSSALKILSCASRRQVSYHEGKVQKAPRHASR